MRLLEDFYFVGFGKCIMVMSVEFQQNQASGVTRSHPTAM